MSYEVHIYVHGLKNFILFYLNVFNEIEHILVVYVNACVMCIMNFNFAFLNCLANIIISTFDMYGKELQLLKYIDDEKRSWFLNFPEPSQF